MGKNGHCRSRTLCSFGEDVPTRLVCCWLLVAGGRVVKKWVLMMDSSEVRMVSIIRDEALFPCSYCR